MNWYLVIGLSIICGTTMFGMLPLARYFILLNESNRNRKEYRKAITREAIVMMALYTIGILIASIKG